MKLLPRSAETLWLTEQTYFTNFQDATLPNNLRLGVWYDFILHIFVILVLIHSKVFLAVSQNPKTLQSTKRSLQAMRQ
jgi:hypothetical protein